MEKQLSLAFGQKWNTLLQNLYFSKINYWAWKILQVVIYKWWRGLKWSALDHEKSVCHIWAVKEKEHKEVQRAGQSIQPQKVTIEVPSDAPIKHWLNKMMSTEKEGLQKLFNMVY